MSNINSESKKDPAQLEREVDQQRAHMSDTLSALEEKLSPNHFVEQIVAYTREHGGEFSHNLIDTIKRNPVPTLLTAVGIAWLVSGQSKPTAGHTRNLDAYRGTRLESGSPGISETAAHLTENFADSMSDAKQRAVEAAEKVRHRAHQTGESLREQSHRARAGFTDLLHEQPLALGALGIAIGALLGGALPSTAKEDQLLGEASDRLADQAKSKARETYAKVEEVGEKIAQDVKRDVSAENLQSRPQLQ